MSHGLTSSEAKTLYDRGLAIVSGTSTLITRHAFYDWNATAQVYERTHAGLRVTHHMGARWNGTRFVRCACEYCRAHPDLTAQVDIAKEDL